MTLTMIALVGSLLVGVPFAYALLGASFVYYLQTPDALTLVVQRVASSVDSYPLAAILLFLFAGSVIARGGVGVRLLGFAELLVGHRRGGLAHVNVLNSLIMGGMSGSGLADVVLDLRVIAKIMVEKGYPKDFSTALSVATGVIAPIMPPGILVIVYSIIAGVSVGRMFMASIVPAILLALSLFVVVAIQSRTRNFLPARATRAKPREIGRGFRVTAWALLMPALLIGGLRMGVFTPTELSAILALYALALSVLIYRDLKLRAIGGAIREALIANASVVVIIAAGSAFAGVLTLEGIPRMATEALLTVSESPVVVLLIINLVLLIFGTVMGASAILIIMTPILGPVAAAVGVDPIHLGTILVVNLIIGALTPPFGIYLLTASGITGLTLTKIARAMIPFYAGLIAALLLITYIPAISLTLPSILAP